MSALRGRKILVHDMCLRDGMHTRRHQFTIAEMVAVARGLDAAGVPMIEVTHGDGLGGASMNYGFPKHTDEEYLRAVVPVVERARVSVLLIPGIGTVEDLEMAVECGAACVRVATHCTEADIAEQHLGKGRELGLDVVGFLMMAHMAEPDELVRQAKVMEAAGAGCVYVTDSAGFMLPDDVRARVGALRAGLRADTQIGFHGHNNLAVGVANSLAAVEEGAYRIDGSAAGLGAGAGNTPLEAFVAACERLGIETGVDLFALSDVAEDVVYPMMETPTRIDRDALMIGFAGVYSTFLFFAKRAEEKYGVPSREILVELGRRRTVGGQEDMVESVALELAERARRTAS